MRKSPQDGLNIISDMNTEDLVATIHALRQELQEQQVELERFRAQADLLQLVSDAIIAVDRAFLITSWNRAAEDIYGWCADEVIGRPIHQVLQTRYAATTPEQVLDHFLMQGSWQGEAIQVHKDGSLRTVLAAVTLWRDSSGFPTGAVSINRDVTEQRRVEIEQHQQHEMFQTILDHIPVTIRFSSQDGRILFTNQAWNVMLGWPDQNIIQNIATLYHDLYPDPAEQQRALSFTEAATGEWSDFRLHTRDGRNMDIACLSIRLADGTRIGFGHDITAQKQAEAEQSRLLAAAQASQQQLQRLSHELINAQEAERRRIAYELHDEIGQQLSGLSMMLSVKNDTEPIFEQAQIVLRQLLGQVRNLALDLRPTILDDLGLIPALVWLFERHTMQTKMVVNLEHTSLEDQRFVPDVELVAYRIVQEGLTNVTRHAGVAAATVRLWIDSSALMIDIIDRGRGFDSQVSTSQLSTGLVSMRERAALLGGTVTIDSTPVLGTHIAASLPI